MATKRTTPPTNTHQAIVTITAFQTEDGNIFGTLEAAKGHNRIVEFDIEYAKRVEDNKFSMNFDGLEPEEVRDWLLSNEDMVRAFLNVK